MTGLAYMGLSRLLWGGDVDPVVAAETAGFPFIVYAANLAFAIALSLSAGLWPPVVLALLAGLLPASYAVGVGRPRATPFGGRPWRTSPGR